ncbi:MAG: hypothetical protein GXP36_08330 [Actinobacteria bacterium]|nr:hypothetical protein [Actinomycetota bacterium]
MTFRTLTVPVALLLVVAACSPADSDGSGSGLLDPTQGGGIPDVGVEYRAFGECMRDKGWEVTVGENSVSVDDTAPGQDVVAAEDAADCQKMLVETGISLDPDVPPSDEQVRAAYERTLEYRSCLVENGYPVSEVPSFEAYLDARLNGSAEDGWNPLALSGEPGDEAMAREAHGVCEADDNG